MSSSQFEERCLALLLTRVDHREMMAVNVTVSLSTDLEALID